MSRWRVAFAAGSRADYGIVRRYLGMLDAEGKVDLSVLVTGALLDEAYGAQVSLVEGDGFRIGARVPLLLDASSDIAVARCMAGALEGFSEVFAEQRPDLLIVLGDRYEMLSVAVAAAMQRVPILHIHGGEATFANYDEFIRHSITKMSLFHFTSTDEYRRRVIQLGEDPERVFNLGALGAENCLFIDEGEVSEEVRALPQRGYFVVLFHPETLSGRSARDQAREILAACEEFPGLAFVFLGSNADTHSDEIRDGIAAFVERHSSARYFENLRTGSYHHLLKKSICLVGNSSSGLIEAPSLGTWTVNVGDRQAGRVRGASVIDVPCEKGAIAAAMYEALERPPEGAMGNPYYQPRCAERYFETTMDLLERVDEDMGVAKRFYDLPSTAFPT